jgi:hypothetical protein
VAALQHSLQYPSPPGAAAGPYAAKCSKTSTSEDCKQLDTNADGVLDATDDMYTPYYPGDDWVDWVGMSVFHFGQVSCWAAAGLSEWAALQWPGHEAPTWVAELQGPVRLPACLPACLPGAWRLLQGHALPAC